MKNLLLLLFTFLSVGLYGQCAIDPNNTELLTPLCDAIIEVPHNDNAEFSFVFQMYAPDEIALDSNSAPIEFNKIVIDTVGAILNLPPGIDYRCNPPNCIIEQLQHGCIELYTEGDVDEATLGQLYEIRVLFTAFLLGEQVIISDTFPGSLFPEGDCIMEIVDPIINVHVTPFSIALSPNPADELIQLSIAAEDPNNLELKIYDFSGKILMQQDLDVDRGEQTYDVDVKHLPPGIYLYSVGNEAGVLTDRLLIARE